MQVDDSAFLYVATVQGLAADKDGRHLVISRDKAGTYQTLQEVGIPKETVQEVEVIRPVPPAMLAYNQNRHY